MTSDLSAATSYHASTVDAPDYEPFIVGDTAIGEVHWIRRGGAGGTTLAVGLWRSGPQDFPYPFATDETIHVLEGVLDIKLASGELVTLRAGDVASFVKGTSSHWTVREPFRKLFIVSDA
ncbi:cupin domain-containing protein [Pseudonocardia xishanensis]|uniref:(S)-ureidoglycine aminohydrolase cupin domain-containing protein n=1 Tax=Pseudonocardia xishanensis TaxID=630995 RepID=A0ABP8S4N0_9PSEU